LQQKIHDKIIERIDAEKAAAAASRSNAETTNEPIAE
jgi:hypothetical protein